MSPAGTAPNPEMYDLIVIGGGPAGTAAAITARRNGATVLLLEQGNFPRHKVCGEFVSPESLALLASLLHPDAALLDQAPRVTAARLFLDGRQLRTALDSPAASISRFQLDFALWRAAAAAGVDAHLRSPVRQLSGRGPFVADLGGSTLAGRSVIDASGRWSTLRPVASSAPRHKWLGIKAHFDETDPPASVDLYFFPGGYCGVQPVGRNLINVSAMLRADAGTTLPAIFCLHQELRQRSLTWRPASDPVATSPLLFRRPEPLRDTVLLAGDAAGFIDPFVGDGIALALRGGAVAAECLAPFWRGEASLTSACADYQRTYERNFLPLFRNARRFRRLLSLPAAVRAPLVGLLSHTGLPGFVVRSTRGCA